MLNSVVGQSAKDMKEISQHVAKQDISIRRGSKRNIALEDIIKRQQAKIDNLEVDNYFMKESLVQVKRLTDEEKVTLRELMSKIDKSGTVSQEGAESKESLKLAVQELSAKV